MNGCKECQINDDLYETLIINSLLFSMTNYKDYQTDYLISDLLLIQMDGCEN